MPRSTPDLIQALRDQADYDDDHGEPVNTDILREAADALQRMSALLLRTLSRRL